MTDHFFQARLGSQRAFTSQTDLSVVPQDCQHIVRILAVKDEAHEDVEVIEPQSPSSLRGAKAFAQQNALAQGRRSPRQSLSATSTPLKPSSHHQASASTGNAHLQVPKNKTLSQLQHGSGVPHEDVRLDVPPLSPLSSMQTMQPDNPAHPIIPNRDQPSNPRSVPNEQPFRRAISLRDPSKNSGNKPSGSNEADAKKGMATVEEADKTGNAPRLLLVYELCPNGTVASFIRRNGGQIGRALWFKWARQIIAALAHCHSFGILHADVKTQNVLLTADLNSRLSDFGSSLAISPSDPPTEGLGLGTTAYNAPELVACPPHPFGLAADVYSAGIVLHTMITGKEPYSTCRNSVEQMLHVSRGGYWSWASRHVWDDSQSLPPPSGHSRPASLYSLASDEDSFPQHTSFSSSRASGSFSAGLSGSSRKGLTKQDVDFLLQTATPTGPHTSASHEEPGLHSSTSSQNYRAVSEEEQLLPVSSLASDDEDESPMTSPRLPSSPPSPAYKCHSRSASLKRSSGLKSYSGGDSFARQIQCRI